MESSFLKHESEQSGRDFGAIGCLVLSFQVIRFNELVFVAKAGFNQFQLVPANSLQRDQAKAIFVRNQLESHPTVWFPISILDSLVCLRPATPRHV